MDDLTPAILQTIKSELKTNPTLTWPGPVVLRLLRAERDQIAAMVERYGMEDPEVSIDVTNDIARIIRAEN